MPLSLPLWGRVQQRQVFALPGEALQHPEPGAATTSAAAAADEATQRRGNDASPKAMLRSRVTHQHCACWLLVTMALALFINLCIIQRHLYLHGDPQVLLPLPHSLLRKGRWC